MGPDEDGEPILRDLALRADLESEGIKGYRWSFRRDVGRARVLVVDSRCGRMLDGGPRTMLSEQGFSWLCEQVIGDYDHLSSGRPCRGCSHPPSMTSRPGTSASQPTPAPAGRVSVRSCAAPPTSSTGRPWATRSGGSPTSCATSPWADTARRPGPAS